jgi:hemoglobin
MIVLGLASLAMATAPAAAQEKKAAGKHDTRALYESLRDVINAGADLFNKEADYAGCYRVYVGGLLSIRPFLPRDLQTDINETLARAEKLSRFSDKAFEVRKSIDRIRAWANQQRPLWERLGGDDKVAALIDDFVTAVAKDPKVDITRKGKFKLDAEVIKQHLIEFFSSISGGPFKYSGQNMKDAHRGMGIADSEYDAMVQHLAAVMKKHKVADADAKAVLEAVEGMRKDIVEKRAAAPPPPKKLGKMSAAIPADAGQVTGKVVFAGRPAPPGFVTLVGKERRFSSSIGPDGTFRFKTPIPPGDYRIAIERTPGANIPAKLDIPERYRSETTSGLVFEVKKGANAFELDLAR